MLPGTSEATNHFLYPASGALRYLVLLGESGQDQPHLPGEFLPPAYWYK